MATTIPLRRGRLEGRIARWRTTRRERCKYATQVLANVAECYNVRLRPNSVQRLGSSFQKDAWSVHERVVEAQRLNWVEA